MAVHIAPHNYPSLTHCEAIFDDSHPNTTLLYQAENRHTRGCLGPWNLGRHDGPSASARETGNRGR